jgi:hypothetical protein
MRRAGSLKLIDGGGTEMGWDTATHERHVSSNIQGDCDQCLFQNAPQPIDGKNSHCVYETDGNNCIANIN